MFIRQRGRCFRWSVSYQDYYLRRPASRPQLGSERISASQNFTQEGGTARGTVAVTVDGQTANVLTASQINATSVAVVPEIINRVVIAGPATVTINPVANATLTITYRKLREGAPITPTPAATPTPTATPTATPTPTP
jgi:hypothetical protein